MDIAADIAAELADEWLPSLYQDKIRSQRTRSISIDVPAKLNLTEIQYTLLGIELKVGKVRFASPDLASARYMRVFARIGCAEFAIPYDITKISAAADELETSWQHSLLLLESKAADRSSRVLSSLRNKLTTTVRNEINEIGPGELMPVFERQTRQRS